MSEIERKELVIASLKAVIMKSLGYSEKDHRLSVLEKVRELDIGHVHPKKFAQAVIDKLPMVFKTVLRISRQEAIRRFKNQNVGDQSRLLLESIEMLLAEGFTGLLENDRMK